MNAEAGARRPITAPDEPPAVTEARWRRVAKRITVTLVLMVACAAWTSFIATVASQTLGDVRRTQGDMQDQIAVLRENQKAAEVRGYKLRAVGCRTIETLGGSFPTDDPCREPSMRPYFTPKRSDG